MFVEKFVSTEMKEFCACGIMTPDKTCYKYGFETGLKKQFLEVIVNKAGDEFGNS